MKNSFRLNLVILFVAFFLLNSCKKPPEVTPDYPSDMVYFGGTDSTFYALNETYGFLKWKYKSKGGFAYSAPTYSKGIVFVGGIDGYIYAFNALNGEIKWKSYISTTGIESSAIVTNGTVYIGTNDDYLYAIDENTGKFKWTYVTGGNVSHKAIIYNDVLYFVSSDGRLRALNPQTGELKWEYIAGNCNILSAPTLDKGIIYFGGRDSYLYAVNAETGSLVWKCLTNKFNNSLESSNATVANGVVYIGGAYNHSLPYETLLKTKENGSLYAIDATTGKLIWEKLNNIAISSDPYIVNDKLYITSDDFKTHCLNATTGNSVWENKIYPNSSSPFVVNNRVYVGGARFFYAFNSSTGAEIWKFKCNESYFTSLPLVVLANKKP
ncbi:MAG: hypothetical protein EAY66_04550 [Sphingobacteriales bacterium]|nr:MAG: hypothetical protein EAY66_04550 [Sphingobacteriales bacterium]